MKIFKIFGILFIYFIFVTNPAATQDIKQIQVSKSPEEINLEVEEDSFIDHVAKPDPDKVYVDEVKKNKPLELKVEKLGFLSDLRLNGAVQAFFDYSQPVNKADGSFNFTFLDTHLWVTGKVSENTDFKVMFNPLRDAPGYGGFQTIFSDVYVQTKLSPHHTVLVGQSRTPIGIDGSLGQYELPFVHRSQIARHFSNIRALGVKHTGSYDYVDYNIGIYDSTRHLQNLSQGTEFTGWVNIKPLAKHEKFGKLVAGTGINTGKRYNSYTVLGTYLGYEYKKFSANVEYSKANGSNGQYNSQNEAEGYYATVAYFVHPKVQILGRYDFFDPNTKIKNNNSREYTLGMNYYIKGEKLKLVANYIFHQNDYTDNSNKFLLMTQILF